MSSGAAPVAVIGAGVAGLAATSALLAKGISVRLLEAQQRSGGRVSLHRLNNGPSLDGGALYIHSKKLMLYARAQSSQLLRKRYPTSYFIAGKLIHGWRFMLPQGCPTCGPCSDLSTAFTRLMTLTPA